jgi:aspartate aminotransferase
VHLEIGEPDFDTPEHIVKAAAKAAANGETHYTANTGLPALREGIADQVESRHGVDVDPETHVSATTGAMEALFLAIQATVDPGAEVVVPTPTYPNYLTQIRMADGVPVTVPLSADCGFELDPAVVTAAIGENTAAVILNSPANPTGRVYEQESIEAIIEAAAVHEAYVIVDEVYLDLVYDRDAVPVLAETASPEHVISVNSFSKSYAMTGWRIGWLTASEDVIAGVSKLHEGTPSCPSSISQNAAIAALDGSQEPVQRMRKAYRERRDFVVTRVGNIPELSCATPEGTFYAFLDVSSLEGTSLDIAKRLLFDYNVVVAPGEGFGMVGRHHLRLSFATGLDQLERGLDRLANMVRDEVT